MSVRVWISLGTFVLIAVILFLTRHELLIAWQLLERVNLWILLLLIPGQALVYLAAGEMIFGYLRAKGSVKHVPVWSQARMSLELNFVNHVLPSGGVSGISYLNWRLSKYGVSTARATMAQVVRVAMGFLAFITLLIVSVVLVTIDGNINRWIILVSGLLVVVAVSLLLGAIFLVSSKRRMEGFGNWITRRVNGLVRRITFGRKQHVLSHERVTLAMSEMHDDFVALRADKKLLIKPYLWGLVFTVVDAGLFMITFWALGQPVNPAPILIAYGVAMASSVVVVTPGGAGAYEAIMVAFLAFAGIGQGTAIAGIVLTRVILLLGTIGVGYLFYQHALIKYGGKKHGD